MSDLKSDVSTHVELQIWFLLVETWCWDVKFEIGLSRKWDVRFENGHKNPWRLKSGHCSPISNRGTVRFQKNGIITGGESSLNLANLAVPVSRPCSVWLALGLKPLCLPRAQASYQSSPPYNKAHKAHMIYVSFARLFHNSLVHFSFLFSLFSFLISLFSFLISLFTHTESLPWDGGCNETASFAALYLARQVRWIRSDWSDLDDILETGYVTWLVKNFDYA